MSNKILHPSPFIMIDFERKKEMHLYYEDDHVALNTVDDNRARSTFHEIMLNRQEVQLLIDALTEMQTNIRERFPLMIEAPK